MGKQKYQKYVEELFRKSPIVNLNSIERITNNPGYAKQLVRNLLLKGKINKLAKGIYTSKKNPELSVLCFKPSYLGLQDALSFHDLWEQETIPIIITSRRVRIGIRNIMGMNVMIKRINSKYIFGFDYSSNGKFHLPYSDIEKTLIDFIYFGENLSEDVLREIFKKINKKKLEKYLKLYPKRIKKIIDNLQF
jgi:predicted transcriptional regulator of viral defense system